MTNAAGRKARFAVGVTCRNRRGERGRHGREALVYAFGGALQPSSYQGVKETYRSRFAMETSYRPMNQARFRTCTKDPLLRLLYVGVALVLRNVGEVCPRAGGGFAESAPGHSAPNSAGVRYPDELCGRTSLYSRFHSAVGAGTQPPLFPLLPRPFQPVLPPEPVHPLAG